MRKLVEQIKKEKFFLLLVIFLGFIAGISLLRPGYFNMHDDLQMMRQLAMEECFRDGQLPCRWTQHMGYGFGFPLFNYYPPLPYLVGQGIRLLGFSFVNTVKFTFFLSFVFSGLAMYLFAREFWSRLGGLFSSAFYIWAPYHALDVYVRGAMNEAWSFVFFPLILWSSYKLVKGAQFRYIVILALSWFGLFTSHNLMVLIFTPLFAAWLLLWLWRERSWFTVPQLLVSGLWGFGLAAFFTLPVLLEKNLVHVETLVEGYYEYIAHFATLNQLLISRFWGYGPSAWAEDFMSFQVGHFHWGLSLFVGGIVLLKIARARRLLRIKRLIFTDRILVILFFLAAGWFATFMAHLRSTPIWQAIEPLKFVQFPWRFVTLSTLSFSTVAGALVIFLNKKGRLKNFVVAALILSVILWNKNYFKPEFMGPLTDEEKFSGAAWELQQTAGIYDYLPKDAEVAPQSPQKVLAEVAEGEAEISNMSQTSDSARFNVSAKSEAVVRINIFQFPNWRVFARPPEALAKGGKWEEVETFVGEDDLGRIHINVPAGEHEITARLYNTPVRTAGNLISLLSWLALATAPIWRRR